LILAILIEVNSWAAVGGSISGTLKDPSGAVIPGATLTVTNTGIGTHYKAASDEKGLYSFPSLAVGQYDLTIDAAGFQSQKRTGLVIDADTALKVDVTLQIGEHTETVTVAESEVQVDTVSTEVGEVVTGRAMTAVALNGRSFTDLLALQ